MNARKLILAISLTSILSISASTWAQQKAENQELVVRLEQMASENDWKIKTSTGAPHQKWLLHQRKVQNLIEKLKAGQSVDPQEIDRILTEHSR